MLTVKITDARSQLVGMLEITNDGSLSTDGNDSPRGSYDFTIWRKSDVGVPGQVVSGRVEDFDRSLGSWELVRRCVEAAAPSGNAA